MTQFVPHQEEEEISVKVTEKELFVINELRKLEFGKVIVHKANGILVRIEPMVSIVIK